MAKKKAPPFKKGGFREKFQEAYGKMKSDRMKERAAESKECSGGKCACGK